MVYLRLGCHLSSCVDCRLISVHFLVHCRTVMANVLYVSLIVSPVMLVVFHLNPTLLFPKNKLIVNLFFCFKIKPVVKVKIFYLNNNKIKKKITTPTFTNFSSNAVSVSALKLVVVIVFFVELWDVVLCVTIEFSVSVEIFCWVNDVCCWC